MQCPLCAIHFHDNWIEGDIFRFNNHTGWRIRTAECSGCKNLTFELKTHNKNWFRVHPVATTRGPVPVEVPERIAQDYTEACTVLPYSPKASAALSRRCLQMVLHEHGYKNKDLSKEIDLLLNETDSRKAIPESLRLTIDGIRNFGNFSAHPITDQTTLQIIDIEPHEAEWCLETVEEMFQHFYVQPVRAKARKAALDAKLHAAGKPQSKP